jgi:sugar lactone lactonase YvrE
VAVDSAGNVYVADTGNNTIRQVTPGGVVTTLAGNAALVDQWGNQIGGYADGTGSAAQFNGPHGVAVDSAGNVHVADTWNNRIRQVTPGGVVTTLGGAAQFSGPRSVAVDSAGILYVADTWNNRIQQVTPGGVVTTLAGLAGSRGSADGTGSAARFSSPFGVAVDSAGNVYVADTGNNTIRKVTPSGVVTTLAGNAAIVDQSGNPIGGYADGTGSAARFGSPSGAAVDSAGNVYVADMGNNAIRKVTPGGVVTTLAGLAGSYGSDDGTGSAARFNGPTGVALDSAGNAYVADTGNNTIRKVTPGGVVTTLAGLPGSQGSADGTGSAARFSSPSGVAVDSAGILCVADTGNNTIRKVTAGGVVTTLAGLAGRQGSADGTGSAAQFSNPSGVAVDSAGNVYVADTANETIRKVTPGGVVTTLAGLAGSWGSADGTGSAAQFYHPSGVAVDGAGNVYVADSYNCMIRKVTPGGVVTTLAGLAGNSGSTDGTGSAALFCGPQGVAVDSAGNVYVADTWNRSIRKVTPGGVVTTLAGLAGSYGSADGTGSAARFGGYAGLYIGAPAGPEGLAVDSAGNIYVADTYNSTIRLGSVACPDAPTIDRAVGPVGQLRGLDTRPQTAVAWQWRLIRAPAGSSAALSATNVRNPTFAPDVADLYVFRLEATNAAGAICIRTLDFTAVPLPPTILLDDGSFGVRSNRFGFSVSASAGQVVVVETSTDLVNWTGVATITVASSPFYFSDPAPPNLRCRFYKVRAQ